MSRQTNIISSGYLKRSNCPVCSSDSSLISASNNFPAFDQSDPRTRIAVLVLMRARERGQFAVDGVESFWNQFEDELCAHCKTRLHSIKSSKREAVRLLEKAVSLSPGNKSIRTNLEAIKSMV